MQVYKAIGEQASSNRKTLARGYFAATVGKSTADEVNNYLEIQSEHHGFDRRDRSLV